MKSQKNKIIKDYLYRLFKAFVIILICVITTEGARKHLNKGDIVTVSDWDNIISGIDNNSTTITSNTTEITGIKTKNTNQDTEISSLNTKVDALELQATGGMIVGMYMNYPKYCRSRNNNSDRCTARQAGSKGDYIGEVICTSTSCACKEGYTAFTIKSGYTKDIQGKQVFSTVGYCYK